MPDDSSRRTSPRAFLSRSQTLPGAPGLGSTHLSSQRRPSCGSGLRNSRERYAPIRRLRARTAAGPQQSPNSSETSPAPAWGFAWGTAYRAAPALLGLLNLPPTGTGCVCVAGGGEGGGRWLQEVLSLRFGQGQIAAVLFRLPGLAGARETLSAQGLEIPPVS